MAIGIMTNRTCDAACWWAREEVCRCGCGGANHGILRVEGAEQPTRTKRIKRVQLELAAVAEGFGGGHDKARELAEGTWVGNTAAPGKVVTLQAASKAQIAKWPELADYDAASVNDYRKRPYLVWRRV